MNAEDIAINAPNYITLPVSYYSPGELTLSTVPGVIQYAQFIQCNSSRGGLPYILINLIQPSNVNFANNAAFALLEISTCPNSWDSSCIVATNYLYSTDDILQPYNNVTIPYNDSASTLYFRLKSEISPVSIAIHVSYVDDSYPIFTGRFVQSVFSNIQAGTNWYYFDQLAKSEEIATVPTGSSLFYYINFCEPAIIAKVYTISVTVTGVPTTPLAGFDLAECAAAEVNIQNCQVYNGNLQGIAASQLAASTAYLELNSGEVSLNTGVYINVFGYGGEVDGSNDFVLSIIETAFA